jgi:signal transduction histidine kinase
MVFKIMREHSGDISVQSTVGEGSSFTLSLPVPQKEKHLLESKIRAESKIENEL